MSNVPRYSVVVPVYNRPGEVEELLASLTRQTYQNFEVIIVEDGSTVTSQTVFEKYSSKLTIQYFFKRNSGPGPSRNFGFQKARGEFFVVFDSDCVIPEDYFTIVTFHLEKHPLDVWGGPDRGHGNFTPLQQAMGYSMSSILTTGGIRGGKNQATKFQPRSFNMGMSRKVYEATGGFKFDRFAEDIEFSIRSKNMGFKVGLIAEAFVYHKRRTSLSQFYRQVSNFGKGRVEVGRAHPGAIKITHWFPALFSAGLFGAFIILLIDLDWGAVAFGCYILYFVLIGLDALRVTKKPWVAILSVPSAFVQLWGYGMGFLKAMFGPTKQG